MANDQYILNHYKRIAAQFEDKPNSTIRDLTIREEEVNYVIYHIVQFVYNHNRFPIIADLGCGNGYLLQQISKVFPEVKLFGLEFSPDLYQIAQRRKIDHCEFLLGDIRKSIPWSNLDLIITERVIINLLSKKQQEKAIRNIMTCLSAQGRYIMMESFQEPLVNLNLMLQENRFDQIVPSKHNFFIREGLIKKLKRDCLEEIECKIPPNQLSNHFVLTRVFHPLIRKSGEKMHNNRLIKFISESMSEIHGDYSPIKFRLFKKRI